MRFNPDLPYSDLVLLSDLHCGNVFGLWPPDFDLSDGGRHGLNAGQEWLWRCWMHAAGVLAAKANIAAYITNGDLIDGVVARTAYERLTTNRADQANAARVSLERFMDVAGRAPIFFVQGCLTPGHRVLTADLRWVPVDDLSVGQALLTVEEMPSRKSRHWQIAAVTALVPVRKAVCDVVFSDGTKIRATVDHPLLVKPTASYKHWTWKEAGRLKPGTRVALYAEPWERDNSYEAGYVAGLIDGEGTLQQKGSVEIGQNKGAVLTRAKDTLERLGHRVSVYATKPPLQTLHVLGGIPENMRLLGQVRPERLIGRMVGRLREAGPRKDAYRIVTEVRLVGVREVVGLSTTSGTYLAEGMAHHNTEFHDDLGGAEIERIAQVMNAVQYAGVGTGYYSHEVLDLKWRGITINFSHGIGVSSGLYRATAPDREGIWSALAGREGKLPPAPVVVRSHAHYFIHVEHESKDILITPCWELQTRYMRRHSPYRMLPTIGLVVLRIYEPGHELGDSRVQVKKLLYGLPEYRPHDLNLEAVLAFAEAVEVGERGAD